MADLQSRYCAASRNRGAGGDLLWTRKLYTEALHCKCTLSVVLVRALANTAQREAREVADLDAEGWFFSL